MTDHQRPTTLLTGATGFLGHFILRELLARGRRVVVLVRPPAAESVRRLAAMMAPIGVDLAERIEHGDVVAAAGGLPGPLPEPDWGRTDEVLHCAASLQLFTNGTNDPFTTNVDGVKALIEWVERHSVRRFHGVSTAYVCGMNRGLVAEVLHSPQPEFQTHYEHSKWIAEWELSRWRERTGGSLTIFRPSFVVGDSETGYTTQFGGFYQLARLVSMLHRHNGTLPIAPAQPGSNGNGKIGGNGDDVYVPLRIPLEPEARHNVVPVDFTAKMIAVGVTNPQFHDGIYHLADPDPPTNEFWKKCFEVAFHLHGGYFVDPRTTNGARSPEEAMLWEQIDVLVPRLRHTPQFCTRNAQRLMESAGMDYPTLNRQRVSNLLSYAAESEWGRRSTSRRNGNRHARATLAAPIPSLD